jgi:calcium-dependent protein kinase
MSSDLAVRLCKGGELFERLAEKTSIKESIARKIFRQMVQAVLYCHACNICHRDLKPENFMFMGKEEDAPLKLVDFGSATVYNNGEETKLPSPATRRKSMTSRVGTV